MGLGDRIKRLVGVENVEFLRHARNYLSGELVTGLIGFASLPVLTRLLTTDEYGMLAVFLSVTAVFALLLELNFRGAVNRYYLERTDDFPDFLKTVLTFITASTIVALGALWFVKEPMARFFRLPPDLFYLALLCAALRIPWNIAWKLMVARQQSARYATLNALKTALQFGIGVAWIYTLSKDRYLGPVYANLLVIALLSTGLSVQMIGIARKGRLRWKHAHYALSFGIPLVPHALSGFILSFFDRIIIAQIQGQAATGLYSVAYDVGRVMSTVVMAMHQSWLPIFIDRRRTEQYGAIERLAATYSKYVYSIALVLVLFAEEIFYFLADEAFRSAVTLIPIIVFSYLFVFLYTLYSNYSFYLRKTWWISLATLLAGTANVALNYWAIPIWGYIAAAWTTLASYMLLFGFHFVVSRFVLRERVIRLTTVMPGLLLCLGVSAAFLFTRTLIDSYWVQLLALKLPLVAVLGWLLWRARKAKLDSDAA